MIGWATVSRWLSRWCWSCFGIAWGLCLLASVATAQGGQQSGPGWESVAVAALGVVSAELAVNAAKQDLDLELARAQVKLESSVGEFEAAKKNLEASKLQAEVYRQRYTLGMISFQDWDVAESDFIRADREMLSARRSLADAVTQVELAQGLTLEE